MEFHTSENLLVKWAQEDGLSLTQMFLVALTMHRELFQNAIGRFVQIVSAWKLKAYFLENMKNIFKLSSAVILPIILKRPFVMLDIYSREI